MKYFAAVAAGVVLGAASPALAFVNVGAITAAQSRCVESEREQECVRVCGGRESLYMTQVQQRLLALSGRHSSQWKHTLQWDDGGKLMVMLQQRVTRKKRDVEAWLGNLFCLKRGTPMSPSQRVSSYFGVVYS